MLATPRPLPHAAEQSDSEHAPGCPPADGGSATIVPDAPPQSTPKRIEPSERAGCDRLINEDGSDDGLIQADDGGGATEEEGDDQCQQWRELHDKAPSPVPFEQSIFASGPTRDELREMRELQKVEEALDRYGIYVAPRRLSLPRRRTPTGTARPRGRSSRRSSRQSRAGPDDPDEPEPPRPPLVGYERHAKHGLVNRALAAFLRGAER